MATPVEVFPSVEAVSVETDTWFITLRQNNDYEQRIDAVEIPRILFPPVLKVILEQMEPDEWEAAQEAFIEIERLRAPGPIEGE